MNTTYVRIAIAGVLFVLIFGLGYWLARAGKPYNPVLFNLHKLIVVGTVIYLAVTLYPLHQANPFSLPQLAVVAAAAVCAIAAIVTGGLVSALEAPPAFVLRLHQMLPYLALASCAGVLYIYFIKSTAILTTG